LYVEAVERGEMAMLRMLLKLPLQVLKFLTSDFSRCLLSKAASLGNEEIVRTLLMLAHWVQLDNATLVKVLVEQCQSGCVAMMQILLEHGVDTNQCDTRHRTPLVEACTSGHTDAVQLLIECGANIDQPCDGYGRTPLFAACMAGHDTIVQVLIEHGLERDTIIGSTGYNSLIIASQYGYVSIMQKLLDAGVGGGLQTSL
jgi:ankyrin repeat protein